MENVQLSGSIRGNPGAARRGGAFAFQRGRPGDDLAAIGSFFAPVQFGAAQGLVLGGTPNASSFADVLGSLLSIDISAGGPRARPVERWETPSQDEEGIRRLHKEPFRPRGVEEQDGEDALRSEFQSASSVTERLAAPAEGTDTDAPGPEGLGEGEASGTKVEGPSFWQGVSELAMGEETGAAAKESDEGAMVNGIMGQDGLDEAVSVLNAQVPAAPTSEVPGGPAEGSQGFQEMVALADDGEGTTESPVFRSGVTDATPLDESGVAKVKKSLDAPSETGETRTEVPCAKSPVPTGEGAGGSAVRDAILTGKVPPLEMVLEAEAQAAGGKALSEGPGVAQSPAQGVAIRGASVLETPVGNIGASQQVPQAAAAGGMSEVTRGMAPGSTESRSALGGASQVAEREIAPRANQTEMIERIARVTKLSLVRNRTHLKMMLYPPELGSVRLNLSLKKGVLNATLTTETGAARNVLGQNLDALRAALEGQGVSVSDLNVSVQGGDQGTDAGSFRPEGFSYPWEKRYSNEPEEVETAAPLRYLNSMVDVFA